MRYLTFFFCLALLSCKNSIKTDQSAHVEFEVNEFLLGETFRDKELKLLMKVPRNWVNAITIEDSVTKAKFTGLLVQDPSIRAVFVDLDNEATLLIRQTNSRNVAQTDSVYANVDTLQQNAPKLVSKAAFRFNDMFAQQYILDEGALQNFQLFLRKEDLPNFTAQVDFFVSKEKFTKVIRSIESSIGSIQPL